VKIIADYPAEEVYSTKRHEVQVKIRERAEAMMGEKRMDQQVIPHFSFAPCGAFVLSGKSLIASVIECHPRQIA
jgi:hypothetical protein